MLITDLPHRCDAAWDVTPADATSRGWVRCPIRASCASPTFLAIPYQALGRGDDASWQVSSGLRVPSFAALLRGVLGRLGPAAARGAGVRLVPGGAAAGSGLDPRSLRRQPHPGRGEDDQVVHPDGITFPHPLNGWK